MKKLILSLLTLTMVSGTVTTGFAGDDQNKDEKSASVDAGSKKMNQFDRKKRRRGYWEFYWDDSNTIVANKGKFRRGKQVGTWKYYSQEGKLERVEKNKPLRKVIKTKQYYPNGRIEKEGMAKVTVDAEYINYFWVGDWKCYDEFGRYVKTEKYEKGELVGEIVAD